MSSLPEKIAERVCGGVARWHPSHYEYFADPAVSHSKMEVFQKSWKRFQSGEFGDETDDMRLGTATHIICFEPDKWDEKIAVWPGGTKNPRRGAKWLDFLEVNRGKTIILASQEQQARAMGEAARKKIGGFRGECEVALKWTDESTGIEMRCKLDNIDDEVIIDLKKSAREPLHETRFYDLGYYRQAALYLDAAQELYGAREWYWVVVSDKPPYDVMIARPSLLEMREAQRENREILDQIAECRRTGEWDQYRRTITIPERRWLK